MKGLLASDRGKRATELFALAYTPVWVGIVAVVMLTGAYRRWDELGHELLGIGVALPLWLLPLFVERDRPLRERHALRWSLLILAFSVLQNYFGTWLFFDAFGMQYHFHVRAVVNGTPLFLYFMTCAYFSTYFAVMQLAWRGFRRARPRASTVEKLGARLALGWLMACAETTSMASPLLADVFSYADPAFVRLWGSFAYGSIFFVTLPLFTSLDEDPAQPRRPFGRVVWDLLALNMLCLIVYAGWGALFRLR